jgi:hypothetical protein
VKIFVGALALLGFLSGYLGARYKRPQFALLGACMFGASIAAVALLPTSNGSSPIVTIDPRIIAGHTAPPDDNDDASATDAPTALATVESDYQRRQEQQKSFLASVNASLTATKIVGNPVRYVGQRVHLSCTIGNIPERGVVNADCGDGADALVIEYDDTDSLDKGQRIRVLGTVVAPIEGTNGFGASVNFPTVKAAFLE